jgi:hypothetical protein
MAIMLILSRRADAQVQVQANMDSVQMLIGEQAHITLDVVAKKGSRIELPQFKRSEYLVPGVEVLSATDADTTEIDNGDVRVRKVYTITSFDENVYALPGMKVKVNNRDYQSNQLGLKVLTVEVDTLHPNQMYPPKDVQEPPFSWKEWAPMFWMSLLVLLLGILGFYLYVRLRQNKPIITRIRIVKHIPAHQKALSAIEHIKSDKQAAAEDPKTYYTNLTDTIRQYISERFGFNAKEMTSAEIIDRLQQEGDAKMISELRELFETADLVKFAKYSTLINEDDLNLVNAVNFIDETKRDEVATEERIVPKLSENERKATQSRRLIKTLLWVIGIVVVVLIAYIIYNIYQLEG